MNQIWTELTAGLLVSVVTAVPCGVRIRIRFRVRVTMSIRVRPNYKVRCSVRVRVRTKRGLYFVRLHTPFAIVGLTG